MRLATIFVLALATTATAGTKAGVTMPDTIQVGDKQLTLNGMGLREATFLNVDVYVAGLYLEKVSSDPRAIISSPQSKRVVMHFVRDVDRKDIVKAWNEGFQKNSTVPYATLKPLVAQLNSWMTDMKKGQDMVFTYEPGKGLAVDVGGARKGVINNDDFARSMFAVWFGNSPPTGDLKKGMLGRHP